MTLKGLAPLLRERDAARKRVLELYERRAPERELRPALRRLSRARSALLLAAYDVVTKEEPAPKKSYLRLPVLPAAREFRRIVRARGRLPR